MKFEPSYFYIGIIDLFAILLPGAIASLVFYHFYPEAIDNFLKTGEGISFYSTLLFLFSAYLFGHIISQLSSYLDTYFYDILKNMDKKRAQNNIAYNKDIEAGEITGNLKKISSWFLCLSAVKTIRETNSTNHQNRDLINNFQWSEFTLLQTFPAAASKIERYTADSKFFRGLFVILLALVVVFGVQTNWNMALACLALALFSLLRYITKREKATQTAYKFIVFLAKMDSKKK